MAAIEGGKARKQAHTPLLVPSGHLYSPITSLLPLSLTAHHLEYFPGLPDLSNFCCLPAKPGDYPLLAQ